MAKFVRFRVGDGKALAGRLDGDVIMRIDGHLFGEWRDTASTYDRYQVTLLPPVVPPNILAIGLNYKPHAEESQMALPDHPVLFLKANTAVCGPGDSIVLPTMAPGQVDYECELAVVIGKRAKDVSEAEALDYVFGYTCGNDVSARDCQLTLDRQWARGKSFDTFNPLGPWIETELEPSDVTVRTWLNGCKMQEGNTRDLIFAIPFLVSYLSRCMTLLPGTVIMSGTPGGVGFARTPPVFLRPGDLVEIEVEGIGRLRNKVVAAT
jgi:2-keto-4-pentenoate hydratase/2-oxohepta-3-ene-1,7-dioic acid hydratase in catechol pathway